MNFNIIRRISDPMIKILCRRVSTHDIFNDNEEEAIAINETEKVEGQSQLTDHPVEAPIEIDETDDEEDNVSRIIIDDTDEDEVAHLLTDPFAKDRLYTPVVIDETDEEVDKVSHTVINDTDEDEIYKAVGKDNVRQKVIVEPIKKKRCPKLIFFKLAKQLEKIVSKIEKLELISCDLESGITTDFDNCVMLRLQAVEVMNKMCKLNGSSLKSKSFDFKDLTNYPEYNNKLEKLFKKNPSPPSFSKSLQYFKRCNKVYNYGIKEDNVMHEIVQAAFGEILIIIRERRGKEFTESHNCYVTKYDNNEIDPALLDKQLEIKLLENKKKSKSIADAINEFRMKQFTPDLSVHETRLDTNIINNKHFRAMKSLNEKFTQNEMTT